MVTKKPNLFLVGAAKAGTTSIYEYLRSHPQVYGCPVKEPNFFGSDIDWNQFREDYKKKTHLDIEKYLSEKKLKLLHNAFIRSQSQYEALFREAGREKYLLDASTSYLYSENAAEEIYKYNPNSKIILILRDPVERTISHYKMDFSNGTQQEENIIEGIKKDYYTKEKGYGISHLYIELSQYFNQVFKYLNVFNYEQVLILKFDELVQNSSAVEKSICRFLNIENHSTDVTDEAQNQTSMLRFPILRKLPFVRKMLPRSLKNFFKTHFSFLYRNEIPLFIGDEERTFIKKMVKEDWEKTIDLLKKNSTSNFNQN